MQSTLFAVYTFTVFLFAVIPVAIHDAHWPGLYAICTLSCTDNSCTPQYLKSAGGVRSFNLNFFKLKCANPPMIVTVMVSVNFKVNIGSGPAW